MNNRVTVSSLITGLCIAALGAAGCSSAGSANAHDDHYPEIEDAQIRQLLATDRPWLPNTPPAGSTDMAPFAACFDPDSPPAPETIANVNTLIRGSLAKYNTTSRWTTTSINGAVAANTPITLRVSLVPDTVSAPDLNNSFGASTLFATMDSKFGGNRALWISKIQQAFNRWGALTGVSYVWVTAPGVDWDDGAAWNTAGSATRGDVRIAMRPLDGASGVLAFNSYPDNGDMVLDSGENWQASTGDYRFLRNIVMHEHGHGLGLAHVCPVNQTKLLEPFYSSAFDGPQQDDLRGIQFRYGDVNEPNGNAAAATSVATGVGAGQTFTIGTVPSPTIANGSLVSITTDGDQDWYRFDTTAAVLVSATATPLGTTYDSATQSGSTCPTGSPVNALTQADIAVAVIGANGSTVLGSATANAAGVAESVTSILVPAGAPFYVKVYETAAASQDQMYRLTVSTGAVTTFSASDGTYSDGVHLNWTAIPGVVSYVIWRGDTNNRLAAELLDVTSSTSYVDISAVPGQGHYYWLRVGQGVNPSTDVAGPDVGSFSPCKADIGQTGGFRGYDNSLDNNDFIVFIDYYFGGDTRADFGGQGGSPVPDGVLDNNDFIVFIDDFFAGC